MPGTDQYLLPLGGLRQEETPSFELPGVRPDAPHRSVVERAAEHFLSGVRSIGEFAGSARDRVASSRAGEMGPEYKVSPLTANGMSRGAVAAKLLTTLLGSARRDANYRETMRLRGDENKKNALELQRLEQQVSAPTYEYTSRNGTVVKRLSGTEYLQAQERDVPAEEKINPDRIVKFSDPSSGFEFDGPQSQLSLAAQMFMDSRRDKRTRETKRATTSSLSAITSEDRSITKDQAAAESNMVQDPRVYAEMGRWEERAFDMHHEPAMKLGGITKEMVTAAEQAAEDGKAEPLRMLISTYRANLMRRVSAKARARVAPQYVQRRNANKARLNEVLGASPVEGPADDPVARLEALMVQPD